MARSILSTFFSLPVIVVLSVSIWEQSHGEDRNSKLT